MKKTSNKQVLIDNLDSTIILLCSQIKKDVKTNNYAISPIETTKVLTELIYARTQLTKK